MSLSPGTSLNPVYQSRALVPAEDKPYGPYSPIMSTGTAESPLISEQPLGTHSEHKTLVNVVTDLEPKLVSSPERLLKINISSALLAKLPKVMHSDRVQSHQSNVLNESCPLQTSNALVDNNKIGASSGLTNCAVNKFVDSLVDSSLVNPGLIKGREQPASAHSSNQSELDFNLQPIQKTPIPVHRPITTTTKKNKRLNMPPKKPKSTACPTDHSPQKSSDMLTAPLKLEPGHNPTDGDQTPRRRSARQTALKVTSPLSSSEHGVNDLLSLKEELVRSSALSSSTCSSLPTVHGPDPLPSKRVRKYTKKSRPKKARPTAHNHSASATAPTDNVVHGKIPAELGPVQKVAPTPLKRSHKRKLSTIPNVLAPIPFVPVSTEIGTVGQPLSSPPVVAAKLIPEPTATAIYSKNHTCHQSDTTPTHIGSPNDSDSHVPGKRPRITIKGLSAFSRTEVPPVSPTLMPLATSSYPIPEVHAVSPDVALHAPDAVLLSPVSMDTEDKAVTSALVHESLPGSQDCTHLDTSSCPLTIPPVVSQASVECAAPDSMDVENSSLVQEDAPTTLSVSSTIRVSSTPSQEMQLVHGFPVIDEASAQHIPLEPKVAEINAEHNIHLLSPIQIQHPGKEHDGNSAVVYTDSVVPVNSEDETGCSNKDVLSGDRHSGNTDDEIIISTVTQDAVPISENDTDLAFPKVADDTVVHVSNSPTHQSLPADKQSPCPVIEAQEVLKSRHTIQISFKRVSQLDVLTDTPSTQSSSIPNSPATGCASDTTLVSVQNTSNADTTTSNLSSELESCKMLVLGDMADESAVNDLLLAASLFKFSRMSSSEQQSRRSYSPYFSPSSYNSGEFVGGYGEYQREIAYESQGLYPSGTSIHEHRSNRPSCQHSPLVISHRDPLLLAAHPLSSSWYRGSPSSHDDETSIDEPKEKTPSPAPVTKGSKRSDIARRAASARAAKKIKASEQKKNAKKASLASHSKKRAELDSSTVPGQAANASARQVPPSSKSTTKSVQANKKASSLLQIKDEIDNNTHEPGTRSSARLKSRAPNEPGMVTPTVQAESSPSPILSRAQPTRKAFHIASGRLLQESTRFDHEMDVLQAPLVKSTGRKRAIHDVVQSSAADTYQTKKARKYNYSSLSNKSSKRMKSSTQSGTCKSKQHVSDTVSPNTIMSDPVSNIETANGKKPLIDNFQLTMLGTTHMDSTSKCTAALPLSSPSMTSSASLTTDTNDVFPVDLIYGALGLSLNPPGASPRLSDISIFSPLTTEHQTMQSSVGDQGLGLHRIASPEKASSLYDDLELVSFEQASSLSHPRTCNDGVPTYAAKPALPATNEYPNDQCGPVPFEFSQSNDQARIPDQSPVTLFQFPAFDVSPETIQTKEHFPQSPPTTALLRTDSVVSPQKFRLDSSTDTSPVLSSANRRIFCHNCYATKASSFRQSKQNRGTILCNPCQLYEYRHKIRKPIPMKFIVCSSCNQLDKVPQTFTESVCLICYGGLSESIFPQDMSSFEATEEPDPNVLPPHTDINSPTMSTPCNGPMV